MHYKKITYRHPDGQTCSFIYTEEMFILESHPVVVLIVVVINSDNVVDITETETVTSLKKNATE